MSTYEQQAIDFLKNTNTEFTTEFVKFDSMPWDTEGQKRNIFKCTFKKDGKEFAVEFGASIVDSCEKIPILLLDDTEINDCGSGFKNNRGGFEFMYSCKPTIQQMRDLYNKVINESDIIKLKDVEVKFEIAYEELKKRENKKPYNQRTYTNGFNYKNWPTEIYVKIIINIKKELERLQKIKGYSKDIQSSVKHPTAYDVLASLTKYDPGTFENFCSEFGYDTDSRRAYSTWEAVTKEWEQVSSMWTDEELDLLCEIQ